MAENSWKSSFELQAGLALMLFDDFTDRPVSMDLFRIISSYPLKLERKQGGILVLMNTPEEEYKITIESPIYETRTLSIRPGSGCQKMKLRMIPSRGYPLEWGTLRVTGYAEPGSAVYLACDTGERFLHLIKDYRSNDGWIWLYCRSQADLEGKQICLISEDEEERCYLEEASEDGESYRLRRPLHSGFSKIGTRVFPVQQGQADKNGWYQILVKEPVKRLIGWNRRQDGKEVRREYIAGQQEARIEISFL